MFRCSLVSNVSTIFALPQKLGNAGSGAAGRDYSSIAFLEKFITFLFEEIDQYLSRQNCRENYNLQFCRDKYSPISSNKKVMNF